MQDVIGAALPAGTNKEVFCSAVATLCCARQTAGLSRVPARGAVVTAVQIM